MKKRLLFALILFVCGTLQTQQVLAKPVDPANYPLNRPLQSHSQLFVSPNGNDASEGSIGKPLKTIQVAIQKAEKFNTEGEVEIILRGGCYEQNETLEIKNSRKGKHLSITSYQQEKVSISGGKKIASNKMKRVTDRNLLSRLQPQVRQQIKEIDLRAMGIALNDLRPSGFGRPSSASWSELFVNEEPMRIARWPNDSTVLIGKIIEAGTGEHKKAATFPVFQYNESRPSAWTEAGEFWISGYFAHGYADDMIKVQQIDTIGKTIHTAQHTVYGFMTNAPFRRWYALNLLEELDVPGEYVIDAVRGKMYLYPPVGALKALHISISGQPLMAIENCSDVWVEGITFEYGRSMAIYLENTHHVIIKNCTIRNMGGVGISVGKGTLTEDKTVLKPHSAEAGGVPASRVVGDIQGKLYQDVLFDRQGGTNNGIVNCYIYNVGAGGISLGGGDRASLTPAGNYVENCRIHDFNRVEKSYRAGIWMDGVGNRISKCDIYNAPSMAILFHGNNHLIELCKITNVCGEVDDQGAIYYGRDPSEQGHIIRYCYFNELSPRHRVTATYHDDGACGAKVYGNIYYKAGSMPVLIGGGHDNQYTHNIFIDSPVAIHLDNRMQNWGTAMVAPKGIIDQRLKAVKHTAPPYSTAYPLLANYWNENPAYPKRNLVEGNLFYKIGNVISGRTEWGEFCNNWVTDTDPGFVDTTDPLKGFKAGAKLFEHIKDFPQLPFEEIGCNLPTIR